MNYTPSSCLSLSALLTGSAAKLHLVATQPQAAQKKQRKPRKKKTPIPNPLGKSGHSYNGAPSKSSLIRWCRSKSEFLTADYILNTMRAKGVAGDIGISRVTNLLHTMVGKGYYETDENAKWGEARFRLIR